MIVAHANYLVSAGHDICIITAVFDSVFTLDSRISLKILPSPNKLNTILSAIKSKFASDLVIADIIPMACFLFLRNNSKVVFFAQDYDESYYTSSLLKGLIRCFYCIGLKWFRIPAIAVSLPLADLLEKRFCATVTLAENGVDTGVFFPDSDQELIDAKGKRKAVLLLSRSDRRKGFDIAHDVITCLSRHHSDRFEVWTVGEPGAVFPSCLVHRDFGYVGEQQLRRIMSSADIFFYPTRHEGLPLMPLEAMACGCPVSTTKAVPYAIHRENALVTTIENYHTLTEQIQELLDSDSVRNRLAETGRQFACQHSLSEATERFEVLLAGITRR